MISFRYQNVMASRVGPEHGLGDADLEAAISATGALCKRFADECSRGAFGFARLPTMERPAKDVTDFAAAHRGAYRNFVQIGIGGSALGAASLQTALGHRFHNDLPEAARKGLPRFFVLDNVDPEETHALFETIDPRETLFHIVTKSGDTTETMAGFLLALDRTKKALGAKWKQQFAFTTDPKKGFLRKLAQDEGVQAFDIPEEVGGRFSVLSAVGLLPAAMLGMNVPEILEGAADMHEKCERPEPRNNPGYLFALLAHLLDVRRGKHIHVMMPYSRALRDVGDWFRQLWAESLGKNPRVGPTPVLALGATDQHSQVQLYNEGPNDKYVIFVEVAKPRADEAVPAVLPADASPAFVQGRRFSEILSALKRGTESALVQAKRPNSTIRMAEISARSVGSLFMLLEAATLFAGRMYDVNPFDQPGVEAGKKAAFALLGRPGYPAPAPVQDDPRYEVS